MYYILQTIIHPEDPPTTGSHANIPPFKISLEKTLLRDLFSLSLTVHLLPSMQLECVGGSAGCHSYRPRVVQCRNVGFDGYDVQWQCTADMDAAYRFGRVEVSCEGYDNPDDPYILRGSCGVRTRTMYMYIPLYMYMARDVCTMYIPYYYNFLRV